MLEQILKQFVEAAMLTLRDNIESDEVPMKYFEEAKKR